VHPVYLDWNATTPPHPDVVDAMREAARSSWGNPASLHRTGRAASAIVEGAREKVAALVGFSPRDVVFTSGGTEANNLALLRPFSVDADRALEGLCVTSRAEHPSVTAVAELLERRGVRVAWLDVPASGRIEPEQVDRALAIDHRGPRLVALQAVNHETGVIQPIREVALIARRRGADLHVDAVQAAGRLAPEAWQGADSVALAAHKARGPKGIGALAVRAGITIKPLLRGGGQERGLRPGTVDPVAAAGFERHRAPGPTRFEPLLVELGGRRAGRRSRPRGRLCVRGKRVRSRDARAISGHRGDARRRARQERRSRFARRRDDQRRRRSSDCRFRTRPWSPPFHVR
jgi:cysteine desulfurase